MWNSAGLHRHGPDRRDGFPGGGRCSDDGCFRNTRSVGHRRRLCVRFGGDEESSPFGRGSKDAAVSNQVSAWSGHQRREFFQQLQPFKDHVRGSVAPRAFESIEQASVGQRFNAFHRDWWPGAVSRQTFQALAVSSGNRDIRVQAEAVVAGTSRTGQGRHALRIDLIPHAGHASTGVGSECRPARYGGGIEVGQPRLIALERIVLFRIGVGSQATTDEPSWDTFGQRPGQSGDFVVPRGRHRMKPRIAVVIGRVHAIDGQHVQV